MNDLIYNRKIKQHLKRIANTCSGSRNKKMFQSSENYYLPVLFKQTKHFLPVRTYVQHIILK